MLKLERMRTKSMLKYDRLQEQAFDSNLNGTGNTYGIIDYVAMQ